jgi:hypothetical protein
MMRRLALILLPLALAACNSQPAEQESANDFAARIGQKAEADPAQAAADAPNKALAAPPAGADVTKLEKLGDLGGVNLGPRQGTCTFIMQDHDFMIAGGMKDPTLPGKAVVQLGGSMVMTDADQGGLEAIKAGTIFRGEGFTVTVVPSGPPDTSRQAIVTVSAPSGEKQSYSGNWVCA